LLRSEFKSLLGEAYASAATSPVRNVNVSLIIGLFILHDSESKFLVTRIHNFALGSTLKFNHSIRNDLCVSLLSLALYQETTLRVWEEGRLKFKPLKSGRR